MSDDDDIAEQAKRWLRNKANKAEAASDADKLFAKLERVDAFHAGGDVWLTFGWYADGQRKEIGLVAGDDEMKKAEAEYKARDVIVAYHGTPPRQGSSA